MEPHRRYTQVVKIPFHISMAALDIETSGEEPAQVICGYEGKHYLLCTLQKGHAIQCALDLEFAVRISIFFIVPFFYWNCMMKKYVFFITFRKGKKCLLHQMA